MDFEGNNVFRDALVINVGDENIPRAGSHWYKNVPRVGSPGYKNIPRAHSPGYKKLN